ARRSRRCMINLRGGLAVRGRGRWRKIHRRTDCTALVFQEGTPGREAVMPALRGEANIPQDPRVIPRQASRPFSLGALLSKSLSSRASVLRLLAASALAAAVSCGGSGGSVSDIPGGGTTPAGTPAPASTPGAPKLD